MKPMETFDLSPIEQMLVNEGLLAQLQLLNLNKPFTQRQR